MFGQPTDEELHALRRQSTVEKLCEYIGALPQDRAVVCMAFVARLDYKLIHHPAFEPLVRRHYKAINDLREAANRAFNPAWAKNETDA